MVSLTGTSPPPTTTATPGVSPSPALTPEAAQAEIDATMKDPTSDYLSPRTPEGIRQRAIDRMEALYRIAQGGQSGPPEVAPVGASAPTASAEPPAGEDVSTLPQLADGESWDPVRVAEAHQEITGRGFSEQFAREGLQLYGELSGQLAPPLQETLAQMDDTILAQADLAAAQVPDGMWNDLVDRGVAMQPRFIRYLASLGKHLAPVQRQIAAIKANRTHSYWAGDPKAVQEVNALYKILKGTKPKARVG